MDYKKYNTVQEIEAHLKELKEIKQIIIDALNVEKEEQNMYLYRLKKLPGDEETLDEINSEIVRLNLRLNDVNNAIKFYTKELNNLLQAQPQ